MHRTVVQELVFPLTQSISHPFCNPLCDILQHLRGAQKKHTIILHLVELLFTTCSKRFGVPGRGD